MELTRREILKTGGGVAAAITLPPMPEPSTSTVVAEEAATEWSLHIPMAYGDPRPWMVLEDEEWRLATDDEIREAVKGPYLQIENLPTEDIRRVFADSDGELFAAFAEYRQAGFRNEPEAAAEALDRICTTPARTNVGAGWQLTMIRDSLNGLGELNDWQRLNLVMSATSWLQGGAEYGGDWVTRAPHPSLAEAMAERRPPVRAS